MGTEHDGDHLRAIDGDLNQTYNLVSKASDSRSVIVDILQYHGYEFLGRLGKGTFGEVIEMCCPQGNRIALKIVAEEMLSYGELQHWQELDHPNVLPLLDILYIPEYNGFVFAMPSQAGTLESAIHDEDFGNSVGDLDMVTVWLRDILKGLNYLQKQNLAHLDLKSNNILISGEGMAMLCDYSFLTSTEYPVRSIGVPSVLLPPEASRRYGAAVDGVATDMWTYGLLALEALTGIRLYYVLVANSDWTQVTYPYLYELLQEQNMEKCIRQRMKGVDISKKLLREIRNFILMLLRIDPSSRLTAAEALKHEFLSPGSGVYYTEEMVWTCKVNPLFFDMFFESHLKGVKMSCTGPTEQFCETTYTMILSNCMQRKRIKIDWNANELQTEDNLNEQITPILNVEDEIQGVENELHPSGTEVEIGEQIVDAKMKKQNTGTSKDLVISQENDAVSTERKEHISESFEDIVASQNNEALYAKSREKCDETFENIIKSQENGTVNMEKEEQSSAASEDIVASQTNDVLYTEREEQYAETIENIVNSQGNDAVHTERNEQSAEGFETTVTSPENVAVDEVSGQSPRKRGKLGRIRKFIIETWNRIKPKKRKRKTK